MKQRTPIHKTIGNGWKATAAIMVVAVAIFYFLWNTNPRLVLRNDHTGQIYQSYPLQEGQRFSIAFIHSVNKSPVKDIYEIRNGKIYVVETIYYSFGAGVQTEIEAGQILTYGEDGSMIVSQIDIPMEHLSYMVGTWSDHILSIGTEEISLRDLCGKSSLVHFSYE